MTKNELIIQALTQEKIRLEYYGHTHVVQRVDENLRFINRVLMIAEAPETEFDLTITATNTTVIVTRNGQAVTAGADVLNVGDVITITAAGATGYTLSSLTLNGIPFTSGNTYTVTGDVVITATSTVSTYNLSVSATNATVSVTRGGSPVTAGSNVLSYGDVLTITASAESGYEMSTLTVNGVTFTSGNTYTVMGSVAIVATAEQAQTGYTVTVYSSARTNYDIYDGQDDAATHLAYVTDYSITVVCASGYLYIKSRDPGSAEDIAAQTTGGVTLISTEEFPYRALFSVVDNGTIAVQID